MNEENNEILKLIAASLQSIDERLAILISQTAGPHDPTMWSRDPDGVHSTGRFENFVENLDETQAFLRKAKAVVDRESAKRVSRMSERNQRLSKSFKRVWDMSFDTYSQNSQKRSLQDFSGRLELLGWDTNQTRREKKMKNIIAEVLKGDDEWYFQYPSLYDCPLKDFLDGKVKAKDLKIGATESLDLVAMFEPHL